jgi:hypothetical protein
VSPRQVHPHGEHRAIGVTRIGTFPNSGVREFMPPDPGEMLDWILVLDDVLKNYSPPGAAQ